MHDREVVIQAGAFGEHRFTTARTIGPDEPEPDRFERVQGSHLTVQLPPGTEIQLSLGMERFVNQPTVAFPWD